MQVTYQQPGEKKKPEIRPDIVGFDELGENRKGGWNYFSASISGGTSIYWGKTCGGPNNLFRFFVSCRTIRAYASLLLMSRGVTIKRLCQEKKDLRKQERAIFFLQGIDVLEHTPVSNVITHAEISKVDVSAIISLHQSPIRIRSLKGKRVMKHIFALCYQGPFRAKRTRKSSVPDRAQWF